MSINDLMKHAKKSVDDLMQFKIKIDNDALSLEQRLESDELLTSNPNYDYIKIFPLMIVSYTLKTMKLFFFILSFSFFSAMFFRMFLEIEHDLYQNDDYYVNNGDCSNDGAEGYFRLCYGLEELPMQVDLLRLMYYMFTSLSTVGFGDFHPKSNLERVVIAFFLLFGVACFSYIMGTFIEILDKFKAVADDINYGDDLAKFFGILNKFNNHEDIDIKLKERIETYFDYRWTVDKNNIVCGDEYSNIVEQLDTERMKNLYNQCLFTDFYKSYGKIFALPKPDITEKKVHPETKEPIDIKR